MKHVTIFSRTKSRLTISKTIEKENVKVPGAYF